MNMKKTLFSVLAALGFMAQAAQTPDFHYFDHRNLIVIQGQIMNIESEELYGKKAAFLMLSIQSEDQRLFRVEVCPQWFLAADIAVGMKIRVRGSLLEIPAGTPYLIAQEISIQGERITLRDSKGFPLWNRNAGSGHGKRRGPGSRGRT
jgi:hypothetical protein